VGKKAGRDKKCKEGKTMKMKKFASFSPIKSSKIQPT